MVTTIFVPDEPFKGNTTEPVRVKEPPKPVAPTPRRKATVKTPEGGDSVSKVEGE